jgi:hypothetical protein
VNQPVIAMTYFGAACEFADGVESKDSYSELIPVFPHEMFHVEHKAQNVPRGTLGRLREAKGATGIPSAYS